MFSYDRLWQTMAKKGITKYKLHTEYKISKSLLSRLSHNQSVNTNTLDRLCNLLECDIQDIVEHKKDDNMY